MKTATTTSILALASFCTLATARADGLLVSFYNSGTVGLYDGQTGSLLNANFASVQDPTGMTIGPDQNLYVGSDSLASGNGSGIVRFGINGTTSTPQGTFVDHVSDNALSNPQGLAFHNGNLYAADITAGNIFVYNSAGSHVSTLSDPIFGPMGLAFSPSGTLYVANQGNILSYNGGSFSQVNNGSVLFTAAKSVAVGGNGNLYVLDISGPTTGIYSVNPSDSSTQKIVDYSTSYFYASDLIVGPDGKLYVSGQDASSGEGEILTYNTDGSGGNVFADTGFGTDPGPMIIIPEPSSLSIMGLAVAVGAVVFIGKRRVRPSAS